MAMVNMQGNSGKKALLIQTTHARCADFQPPAFGPMPTPQSVMTKILALIWICVMVECVGDKITRVQLVILALPNQFALAERMNAET